MTRYSYLTSISTILSCVIFSSRLPSCECYFYDPEFNICDATEMKKYRKNFCESKLVFTSNSTKINSDCICASGIWIVINRDCNPSTLVTNNGCILTPQIKAMQYLGALRKNDFFAVVTQSEVDFAFTLLRPVQTTILSGQIWLFNGVLSRAGPGSYCAEKWHSRKDNKAKSLNKVSRYSIDGRLTVQYECWPHYTKIMTANLEYDIRNPESSECTMNCSKRPASKLIIRREMKVDSSKYPTAYQLLKNKKRKQEEEGDQLQPEMNKEIDISETSVQEMIMSPSVRSLVHFLHRRFLLKMMAFGFSQGPYGIDSQPDHIPQSSFKVLEKLKEVTFKTCAGRVSKVFLDLAYVMFRVAYENRGTNLMEYLKEQEEKDIFQFLNECHASVKPLNFNKDIFCPDELIKTVQMGDEFISLNVTENFTSDYYLKHRHLAMEIPWNMIDLTLAMCIEAFAESYILYHKMEQALEKLFIKDLKILWQYPPKNEMLYTRLYGPNWRHYAENLERCVQAVYIHNPMLTRLRKPGEIGLLGRPTSKLGSGNGRHHLGYHVPIKIPEITVRNEKASDASQAKNKPILKYVDLACRSLNAPQCYFD